MPTAADAVLGLRKVGFSEEQVSALGAFLEVQAATKADVADAVHRLERRIDALEARIDRLGLQLTARLGGLVVAGIVILGGLQIYLRPVAGGLR
jgi:hypothetical protein